MKTINSLLLVTLFSFYGTLRPTQPQGIYAFCNYLGTLTDKWLSDGDLSPEQQKMFEDITQTMGLEYRMLKAKKTGSFGRRWWGDFNALAYPLTNRVYFSEQLLKLLPAEQLQFVIAHELSHHRNHHGWKRVFLAEVLLLPLYYIFRDNMLAVLAEYKTGTPHNHETVLSHLKNLIATALGAYASSLMIYQVSQKFEIEADTDAIAIGDIDPAHGIAFFNQFEDPIFTYQQKARTAQGLALYWLKMRILFAKLHSTHPPTHERQAHLRSLLATPQQ